MDQDLVEFSEGNQYDEIMVEKFEEAHNLANFMLFFIFIVLPILYFAEGWVSSYFGTYAQYYTEVWAVAVGISIVIWYLARRARKATGLTREDLTVHYFCLTIESYDNADYEKTSEYLHELEDHATKNTNDLLTDSVKDQIEEYVDRIEESGRNKELLDQSFEEFAIQLGRILQQNNQFDELVKSGTDEAASVSSRAVIAEGAKTLPMGRYFAFEILAIILALVVFFYYNENLGMLLAVSLLTVIPRISESRD